MKMSKKYFWEQQEWLDRIKKINPDFYNIVKNAKNIELDFDTFSLIIDGVKYELTIYDCTSKTTRKIKIIENGKIILER